MFLRRRRRRGRDYTGVFRGNVGSTDEDEREVETERAWAVSAFYFFFFFPLILFKEGLSQIATFITKLTVKTFFLNDLTIYILQ